MGLRSRHPCKDVRGWRQVRHARLEERSEIWELLWRTPESTDMSKYGKFVDDVVMKLREPVYGTVCPIAITRMTGMLKGSNVHVVSV